MTPEELKEILAAALDGKPVTNFHVHYHKHIHGESDEPGDDDPEPKTHLIEVVTGESFKEVQYYNDADIPKPVMGTAKTGWRSSPDERYLALVDSVAGDGSTRWWKLWMGFGEDTSVRGYYLNVEKCRKVG